MVSNSLDKISWYENYGFGIFGNRQYIAESVDAPASVYASDLDGDGDNDVISANDNTIACYENNGNGIFGMQQIITTDALKGESVFATDLDEDGDIDVLSASSDDNKIAWYENDGDGNFGEQQIISTSSLSAQSVYATDLDGDGDMDVLSASYDDNKIAWYENTLSVGLNEADSNLPFRINQNYPNPFSANTNISFDLQENQRVQIKVYDVNGIYINTLVDERMKPGKYSMNFSGNDLPSGTYFYNIQTGDFNLSKKMFLIK